jgi:short-subunit dehydrogenase
MVLGASEGLGAAYAHGIAARGVNVIAVARRADLVQRVAADVAARHSIESRAFALDLAADDLIEVLASETNDLDIGLVVYNGASGYVGSIAKQGVDSLRSIIAVNCAGPLLVAEHFGHRMLERGRGGIVIMGSAAGLAGSGFNSAYAASKAFDIVLGESLWAEWRDAGVDVLSVIGPAIDTPNYRAANSATDSSLPSPIAPELVVEEVLVALGTTPSFVPGEEVRTMLAALGTLPRHQQVEALSAAQAHFAS